MSRTTTFIAVLQTTLVVVGFLILPGIFKLWGYPNEPLEYYGYRWNPLSLWLRQYGPWLLVLPVFWVVFATTAQRRDRGFFSQRLAVIGIPCAPVWRTAAGLAVAGPAAFGFPHPYAPVEELAHG